MGVNVWAVVGAVTGYIPMSALTGTAGQLLGMNAGGTLAEWKAGKFLNNQFYGPVGSAAAPLYSFEGFLDTGFYLSGGALRASVGGVQRVAIDGNAAYFDVHATLRNKLVQEDKGANIVAAANIDLGTATGNYIYITHNAGDVTITRLGGTASLPSGTLIEAKFVIVGGILTLQHDPNFLNLPGGSNVTVRNGDVARFRKTNDADQFWDVVSYTANTSLQVIAAAQQPINLIHPDHTDRSNLFAAGWLPWNYNEQWGGAPAPWHLPDANTGVEHRFESFDNYIAQNTTTGFAIGDAAGDFYRYQSFIAPKALDLAAVWLYLTKVGNPTDNVIVKLWSVAAGVPGALIATATSISGRQIQGATGANFESNRAGWYRFTFAPNVALTANTQYIITAEKSGGVDAANYYLWQGMSSTIRITSYPNNLSGDGTAAPVWTAANTSSKTFICEAAVANQPTQSGGQFQGRIIGNEATPLNRSVAYVKPLNEFFPLFSPTGWSILIRGKSWTKNKTFAELHYGLHHDRVNIRSANGTGVPTVTVYEKDGTVTTVVGTTDVSTNTFKDILVCGRNQNDGADFIRIYVGSGGVWQKEGESTGLSLEFDPLMFSNGHMWIMGGFGLFASADYTKLSNMNILPSADGWVYAGAAAEVNAFSISNNQLNQIRGGYAAGNDGYYQRTAVGFVNANGWGVVDRSCTLNSDNTRDAFSAAVRVRDGTREIVSIRQEQYTQYSSGAAWLAWGTRQTNRVSLNTRIVTGKGNDFMEFVNGRLLGDLTGFMTNASAVNQVDFGDMSTTAGANADVLWDYVGYLGTGQLLPQFTSGELHEFGVFTGDVNTLGQALYNSGTPLSIKQYCGVANYFIASSFECSWERRGMTGTPTNNNVSYVWASDMDLFVYGREIRVEHWNSVFNNTAGQYTTAGIYMDGRSLTGFGLLVHAAAINYNNELNVFRKEPTFFGQHYIEGRWGVSGGTSTSQQRGIEATGKL